MSDDLVAFLRARLDEDEAAAKAWLPFGNPNAAAREHIARHDPARVLREVEADRAILAELAALPHRYVEDCYYSCPLAVHPEDPEQQPGSGFCNDNVVNADHCWCGRDEFVARMYYILAAVYRDHPDYRQEWAP